MDYRAIIEKLIENYPHEIKKIKKVCQDARRAGDYKYKISLKSILDNKEWDVDEKSEMIDCLDYDIDHEPRITVGKQDMYVVDYVLDNNLKSSFEVLVKQYKKHNWSYYLIYKDDQLAQDKRTKSLLSDIIENKNNKNKREYIDIVLKDLNEEDIKRLITPYYEGYSCDDVKNTSIFNHIILSKDLELIKKYIEYVDDISIYLPTAVSTGDIELVKYFIEQGADINYLSEEPILSEFTPLKTAIVNNDYEMAKMLIEQGADIHFKRNEFIAEKISSSKMKYYTQEKEISNIEPSTNAIKNIRNIRALSPMETAASLDEKSYIIKYGSTPVEARFKGNNQRSLNNLSLQGDKNLVDNRIKIVDLLFEKTEDKSKLNYTDLLTFALAVNDANSFKKYADASIKYNCTIDFDRLFEVLFEANTNLEVTDKLMEFIDQHKEKDNIYLKFYNYFFKEEVITEYGKKSFCANDFSLKLLNKFSPEQRKKLCLVPYCSNVESLEALLNLGFDISQQNEKGENILIDITKNGYTDFPRIDLFNYIIDKIDLSHKDKNGKNALYYAMKRFPTDNEYTNYKYTTGTISKFEHMAATLVTHMKEEDIDNNEITEILEDRMSYNGNKIHYEFIYQHHKELFDALMVKGYVLSDKLLEEIFDCLYSKNTKGIVEDMDKTLEYLYTILDHNTQTQTLDIEFYYDFLVRQIDNDKDKNIGFGGYLSQLKTFYERCEKLSKFYEENIKNKFAPEKYMEYAKKKYNTSYDKIINDQNKYLPLIIIKGLQKYGNDKLEEILNIVPNYNVNSYIEDQKIGMSVWQVVAATDNIIDYDDEGLPIYGEEERFFPKTIPYSGIDEQVEFTGGLMQYAILINDLEMVKLLQSKGAELGLTVDGKSYNWNYVNSYTMEDYLKNELKDYECSDLDEEERKYFIELMGDNGDDQEESRPNVRTRK